MTTSSCRSESSTSPTWASGRPPGTTSRSRGSSAPGCACSSSGRAATRLWPRRSCSISAARRAGARGRSERADQRARLLLQGSTRDGRAPARAAVRAPLRLGRGSGGEGARMSPRPALGDVAELVRLPAVLTVPGDVLLGAAAAGWPEGRGAALGIGSGSALQYLAGMALNDYADREVDAVERPHRPVPSGRVTAGFALGLAASLTGAGIAAASFAGGRPARRRALAACGRGVGLRPRAEARACRAGGNGRRPLHGRPHGEWETDAGCPAGGRRRRRPHAGRHRR